MDIYTTVVDPLTSPVPPEWVRLAERQSLPFGWDAGLVRAAAACAQAATSLVTVQDRVDGEPVALFHVRHVGAADPRRFAAPGRTVWPAVADCRLTPNLDTGVAFSDRLDEDGRAEAVRLFERALLRRGGSLVRYWAVPADQLAALRSPGLRRVRPSHRMVLHRQWSDLDGYLATLPRKLRSQLRRRYEEINRGDAVRFAVEDAVDPQEACWLSERVRRRLGSGSRLPFPPWPPGYFARVNELPRCRYLTYRDRQGRLLAYAVVHHEGPDLVSGIWGYRDEADGGERDLYFDVYLRQVELLIRLDGQRLLLGQGMEHIKARFGARPEPLWMVSGPVAQVRWGVRRAAAPPPPPPTTVPVPQAPPRPRRAATAAPPTGTPACPQCGAQEAAVVLRAGRRRLRLGCRRCHAVTLVPAARRDAATPSGPASPHRHPAPAVGDARDGRAGAAPVGETTALDELMPAPMLRWCGDRMPSPAGLTKPVMYQLYRRWDAHLAKLSDEERRGLAAPGEPVPVAGLPLFSVVVSTLQQTCYRITPAVARLVDRLPDPADPAGEAALRERARHALRWLWRHGRDECWLLDGSDATPPPAAVAEARDALRAGAPLPPEAGNAAREALFGTRRWPGLNHVGAVYPVATLVEALDAYLRDGARPLRDEALARLSGRRPAGADDADPAQTGVLLGAAGRG